MQKNYRIVICKLPRYRIAYLQKRYLIFFWKTIEYSNSGETAIMFNERMAEKYPTIRAKVVTKLSTE